MIATVVLVVYLGGAVVRQRDCLGGVLMSNKRHCLAVEEQCIG